MNYPELTPERLEKIGFTSCGNGEDLTFRTSLKQVDYQTKEMLTSLDITLTISSLYWIVRAGRYSMSTVLTHVRTVEDLRMTTFVLSQFNPDVLALYNWHSDEYDRGHTDGQTDCVTINQPHNTGGHTELEYCRINDKVKECAYDFKPSDYQTGYIEGFEAKALDYAIIQTPNPNDGLTKATTEVSGL